MPDLSSPSYADPTPYGSVPCEIPSKRRSPKENLQRTIIGVVAGLGLGGAFGYAFVKDVWPGIVSLTWSQTQGVIKSGNVEYSLYKGAKDFMLKIRYAYTVNGKQYENDRIRFPESWERAGGEYERKQVDLYRAGSQHAVYYDPSNPARSCLVKGPRYFYAFVFGGLSALSLLVGTVCLFSIPSAWKRAAAG
jgi:hypothetical protein